MDAPPLPTLTARLGAPAGGGCPFAWLGTGIHHWPLVSPRPTKGPLLVHEWKEGSGDSKRAPWPTKFQWSPFCHTGPGKAMGGPVKFTGLSSARVHVWR